MERQKVEYECPLLQAVVVAVEIGFNGTGDEIPEEDKEQGSTTPEYGYEDDTWD